MPAAHLSPSAARLAPAPAPAPAPSSAAASRSLPAAAPLQCHRPFFLAALAMILTLGATWGAALLWRIGLGQSFTSVGIHEVNAHGQAQIYGWVGLFIMGFAYTVFPRMWRSPAPSRRLAVLALATNVGGVLLSALGMRFAGAWEAAPIAALIGAMLIVFGVGVFAMQMLSAYEQRRVAAEPPFLFMLVAIGWFVLSSIFSAAHTWATLAASDRESLLFMVGTYQAALRDVQVHGLALTMILGVSLKILPGMFGLPAIPQRRAVIALLLITLAVAAETSSFVAYRWTEVRALAFVVYACWAMLAAGVSMIVLPWRPWAALPRDDGRSGKFIRAAYIWLAISLVMLLLLPAYQALVGVPFSHAYYGAARHAITVGFISMMIMGVAAKFVPAFRGVPWRDLSSLRGPFILINLGCALRVTLQTATDVHGSAFALVGVSSVLEVAALAWWSIDLAQHLLRRRTPSCDASASTTCDLLATTTGRAARADAQPEPAQVSDGHACCSMCATKAANGASRQRE